MENYGIMVYKLKTISFSHLFVLSFISITLIIIFFATRERIVDFWVIIFVSVIDYLALNRICSGMIQIGLENDIVEVKWLTKPIITSIKEQKIKFDEIGKWDIIGSRGGPNALLIVLKNNTRIRIWFKLFARQNRYGQFFKEFAYWINLNHEMLNDKLNPREKNAVNITEEFYNSYKAKVLTVLLILLFLVDITLIISDLWGKRPVYIFLLVPIIFWGMFHLLYFTTISTKK